MHTKAYTSKRVARRVYRVSPSLPASPSLETRTDLRPYLLQLRARFITVVRNPLFLVIATWLLMAAMLVSEIFGGQ